MLEESLHYCNILEDDYNLNLRHNSDPISVWISTASMDPDFIVKFMGILFATVTGNMESILHALAKKQTNCYINIICSSLHFFTMHFKLYIATSKSYSY